MNDNSILEKITAERSLIFILIASVVIVFIIIIYLFFAYGTRSIKVITPNGEEEWDIGQIHEITWDSKGIEKVGIALFNGENVKWIDKNIDAKAEKYEWRIYPGQDYGDGFWIAVFEYPWKKGSKVDYSDQMFAITYPEFSTCDLLSVEMEWPYLSNDLPNLRRVFITEERFNGDLGGLEGADKKCQLEADGNELGGTWRAFIGDESDENSAVERLKKGPRGTDGSYILAQAEAVLVRNATCHRLLGKTFTEFLAKLSDLKTVNVDKLDKKFLESITNVWLGRVNETSKKNCIVTSYSSSVGLGEKYSFTTTCQNWTQKNKFVGGYPVSSGKPKPSFPSCYTPFGEFTDAVALGALSSGLEGTGNDTVLTPYQGAYCNMSKYLLCIEE